MHALVLMSDHPKKSYRLSKIAAKTAHFSEKTIGYSLWFCQFGVILRNAKVKSKHSLYRMQYAWVCVYMCTRVRGMVLV